MKYFLLIALLLSDALKADELAQLRARFEPVYNAAVAGTVVSATTRKAFDNYPLAPYLAYYALRGRLSSLPVSEVRTFLEANADSLLEKRLRTEWLREVARQGRFDLFASDYTAQDDVELQCHALAGQVRAGDIATTVTPGITLWSTGKPLPDACNPVFVALRATGELTDALVWQRILLAARGGNPDLAVGIARRYASAKDQAFAQLLANVHARPATVLTTAALRYDSPRVRTIVAHGIARLARTSVKQGVAAWATARQRYKFSTDEVGKVQYDLALASVATDDPSVLTRLDAVPVAVHDDLIERYRLREGLKAGAWSKLAQWTADAPRGATTNTLRWRYWQARALEELGKSAAATAAFHALATERDYYGFLASDKLGQPYAMIHRPLSPEASELVRIAALPGIKRAYEFYRLGLRGPAIAEWQYTLAKLEKPALETAAKLAYDWGWVDRTIALLGQIQSYDDLQLRFPMLHKALVLRFAKQRELAPALIYSIIRGESAFVVDARSPVGALGLMQLMPATGSMTAERLGTPLRSASELTTVERNIAIGTEYLREVLHQFNGNFTLAAAAYNAGPSRVRQWLPKSGCVTADVWIDTIPFAETEAYVRRALFYAAIYAWRLGHALPLSAPLAEISQLGASEQCQHI